MSDDKPAPGARCACGSGIRITLGHPVCVGCDSHKDFCRCFVAPPSAEQGAVLTREEYEHQLSFVFTDTGEPSQRALDYEESLLAHDAALRAEVAAEREAVRAAQSDEREAVDAANAAEARADAFKRSAAGAAGEMLKAEAERDALAAKLKEAVEALREIEWMGWSNEEPCCHDCGRIEHEGHSVACSFAAALKRVQAGEKF